MKASTSPFREPKFRLIWQIQKQYATSRAYNMPRCMKIGAIVMRHQCFLRYCEATWLTIVGNRTPTTNCGSKHSCAMLSQIGYLSANQQHNRVSACLCRVQVCWRSDISCLIFMRDSLACVSTAVHINLSSKIKQQLCAIPFCLLASSAHFFCSSCTCRFESSIAKPLVHCTALTICQDKLRRYAEYGQNWATWIAPRAGYVAITLDAEKRFDYQHIRGWLPFSITNFFFIYSPSFASLAALAITNNKEKQWKKRISSEDHRTHLGHLRLAESPVISLHAFPLISLFARKCKQKWNWRSYALVVRRLRKQRGWWHSSPPLPLPHPQFSHPLLAILLASRTHRSVICRKLSVT